MIIYIITNTINNKQYIGQTIQTLNERMTSHIYDSKAENDNCLIHKAIRKYGIDNFKWSTLYKCKTKKELDKMETYYIEKYKTYVIDGGYNLTHGGDFNPMFYKEFRDKISRKCKGKSNPFYGKRHTDEAKNKIKKRMNNNHPSSKKWKIVHKDGTQLILSNLEKFCRDNKLHSSHFRKLKKGVFSQYRGWILCENID